MHTFGKGYEYAYSSSSAEMFLGRQARERPWVRNRERGELPHAISGHQGRMIAIVTCHTHLYFLQIEHGMRGKQIVTARIYPVALSVPCCVSILYFIVAGVIFSRHLGWRPVAPFRLVRILRRHCCSSRPPFSWTVVTGLLGQLPCDIQVGIAVSGI